MQGSSRRMQPTPPGFGRLSEDNLNFRQAARICFTCLIHHYEHFYAGARDRLTHRLPLLETITICYQSRLGPRTQALTHGTNETDVNPEGLTNTSATFNTGHPKHDARHDLTKPVEMRTKTEDYLEVCANISQGTSGNVQVRGGLHADCRDAFNKNLIPANLEISKTPRDPSNGDCEHWPPIKPLSEPLACPNLSR